MNTKYFPKILWYSPFIPIWLTGLCKRKHFWFLILPAVGKIWIGPDGLDRIDKTRTGWITKSLPKVDGHQTTCWREEKSNSVPFSLVQSSPHLLRLVEMFFFTQRWLQIPKRIMKDTIRRIVVNKRIDCVPNGLLLQTWKLTTIFYFTQVPDNCTIAWFTNRKGTSVDEWIARRIVGILLW